MWWLILWSSSLRPCLLSSAATPQESLRCAFLGACRRGGARRACFPWQRIMRLATLSRSSGAEFRPLEASCYGRMETHAKAFLGTRKGRLQRELSPAEVSISSQQLASCGLATDSIILNGSLVFYLSDLGACNPVAALLCRCPTCTSSLAFLLARPSFDNECGDELELSQGWVRIKDG